MADFVGFSGPRGKPTVLERKLIEGSRNGWIAEHPGEPDDPDVQVSAALVTALATDTFQHRDWPGWHLHPLGLELRNATLRDRLALSRRHVKGRLALISCQLKRAFDAAGTRFDEGFWLSGSVLSGGCSLFGAVLAGQFSADRTHFMNPNGDAILAQGVKATDWFMRGVRVEGIFNINSAELAGSFIADAVDDKRAAFVNKNGYAIIAFGLKATRWLMCGARVEGGFNIAGAELTDQLAATAAKIAGSWQPTEFIYPAGRAINAANATVRGTVFLSGFDASQGPRIEGECFFGGAVIERDLDFSNAMFKASRHRAINLRGARVDGDVNFDGATVYGHVNANRARFGGRVGMVAGRFRAASLARRSKEIPWDPHPARSGPGIIIPRDEQRQDASEHHAIVFREAQIEGRLVMPDQLPEGIVDLSRTSCDTLEDKATGWPAPIDNGCLDCSKRLSIEVESEAGKVTRDIQHLVLDGFTYTHLEYPDGTVKGGAEAGAARTRWLAGQAGQDLKTHFNP